MGKRWVLALFMVILAAQAGGTTLARMNLKRLAAAATAIVRARCVGKRSEWEAGEIWTNTSFEKLEIFKGALPSRFTVRLIGGKVGGIESIVGEVPRFWPGEEVVLFLDPSQDGDYAVTAWVEGTFRVRRDRAGRAFLTEESSGEETYNRTKRQFHVDGIRHMPLDEFRQRIRALTGAGTDGASGGGKRPERKPPK